MLLLKRSPVLFLSTLGAILVATACGGDEQNAPGGDPSLNSGGDASALAADVTAPPANSNPGDDIVSDLNPDSDAGAGLDLDAQVDVSDAKADALAVDAGDFGKTCQRNSDCSSRLCYSFNNKGRRCTFPCNTRGDAATTCPGGSTCTSRGVCSVP